jgi:hypothetical protein
VKVRVRGLVLALFIALAGAYVGAFAAARIGIEHVPPLRAEGLAATAFPGLRVFGGGEPEAIEPFGDGEGVKYGSVAYWVKHTDATRDVATYAAGARDRLAAAGWQIHDFTVPAPEPLVDAGAEYKATFWATKPGLYLYFSDYYWTGRPSYDSTGAAAFDIWRSPPSWITTATWGGAVAGFYSLGYGPALLSAWIAGAILVVTVAQTRPVRTALNFVVTTVRRWPKAAVAAVVLVALAFVVPGVLRQSGVTGPACRPAGLPAEAPATETRTSKHVKIFVSNTATEQERALIDAAIFRSRSGSLGELIWQPDSAGFRETYCAGSSVPKDAVAALPYYFDVELANPAYLPALTEEVTGLAGVLAVHRTP